MSDNYCRMTRQKLSLTRQQMANLVGKSKQTIINWEKSAALNPRIIHLIKTRFGHSAVPAPQLIEANLCRQIRIENGLTQKQMANALLKTQRTIINWEKAETLKPRIVAQLLNKFGSDVL